MPPSTVNLPVGPEPDWELSEDNTLKSVAESLVILQSLRQSRERWLSSTFPRFSSKARGGKVPQNAPGPPPHTIQTRGKCDLEIGPHIFPDTVFYEVHYLPSQSQLTPQPVAGWQSASYGTTHVQFSQSSSVAEGSSAFESSSPPLISSLGESTAALTPHLINQVNAAASSNPILANLIQLAAAGFASPEQLKTLGLLIQSLASPENLQLASHSSLPSSQKQTNKASPSVSSSETQKATVANSPVKEFDLVVEFREMSSERWLIPRGPVVYEKAMDEVNDMSGFVGCDALIKTMLPFNTLIGNNVSTVTSQTSPAKSSPIEKPFHEVTLRLRKTPFAIWDTLSRWAGDEEKMQQSREIFNKLGQVDRVYLGHRLSQGSLLSQLQILVAPTFNLKPLKLGPDSTTRTKRTATSRKADSSASKKPDPQSTVPKRRKISQPQNGSVSTQIQCNSCKQTDVPLILGGRYCRPCVEAGQTLPYTAASYIPPSANNSESAEEHQNHPSAQPPSHIPSP